MNIPYDEINVDRILQHHVDAGRYPKSDQIVLNKYMSCSNGKFWAEIILIVYLALDRHKLTETLGILKVIYRDYRADDNNLAFYADKLVADADGHRPSHSGVVQWVLKTSESNAPRVILSWLRWAMIFGSPNKSRIYPA